MKDKIEQIAERIGDDLDAIMLGHDCLPNGARDIIASILREELGQMIKQAISFGWDSESMSTPELAKKYGIEIEYNSYGEGVDSYLRTLGILPSPPKEQQGDNGDKRRVYRQDALSNEFDGVQSQTQPPSEGRDVPESNIGQSESPSPTVEPGALLSPREWWDRLSHEERVDLLHGNTVMNTAEKYAEYYKTVTHQEWVSEESLMKAFEAGCRLTHDAWEREDHERWEEFLNSLE